MYSIDSSPLDACSSKCESMKACQCEVTILHFLKIQQDESSTGRVVLGQVSVSLERSRDIVVRRNTLMFHFVHSQITLILVRGGGWSVSHWVSADLPLSELWKVTLWA